MRGSEQAGVCVCAYALVLEASEQFVCQIAQFARRSDEVFE